MKKKIKDTGIYLVAMLFTCLLTTIDLFAEVFLKKGPIIDALIPVSPQLYERVGYFFAIIMILGLIIIVYKVFKKKNFNLWAILSIAKGITIIDSLMVSTLVFQLLVSVSLFILFIFLAICEKKHREENELA